MFSCVLEITFPQIEQEYGLVELCESCIFYLSSLHNNTSQLKHFIVVQLLQEIDRQTTAFACIEVSVT